MAPADSAPPPPAAAPGAHPAWGPRASLALALAAFAYTVVRAARLSLTHDEALTFLVHATAPWREIWEHSRYLGSNNHLLNTLLVKALLGPLGSSELVLRTPALLGHALYLVALLRILGRSLAGARLVLATAFLALNPLLIDFFSCARGYGLGLGLGLLGLDRLLLGWSRDVARVPRGNGALAAAFLAGAVLANVSFANLFVAALGTALLVDFLARREQAALPPLRAAGATARALLVPTLLAAAVLAAVYRPAVLARILPNVAAWGGTRGFWADTVGSLAECVLYDRPYAAAAVAPLAVAVALLALLSAGVALRALRRAGSRATLAVPVLALLGLLALVALALEAQFRAGRRYPLDRAAIYLVPPFLLAVALTWQLLHEGPPGRARGALEHGFAAFAGALVLHGLLCLNTTHNHLWRFDASTRDAVHAVRDHIGAKRLGRRYRLGVDWRFEPAIDYYLIREGLSWIQSPDRGGPDGTYDYYYVSAEDRALVERRGLVVLAVFPLAGTLLATSL